MTVHPPSASLITAVSPCVGGVLVTFPLRASASGGGKT